LVVKLEERLGYRWEDSIKIDTSEVGSEDLNWIQLFQDRIEYLDFLIR